MLRWVRHIAFLAMASGCAGMPGDRATGSVNSTMMIQAAALEHLIHESEPSIAGEAQLYCIRVGDEDASPELLRILHSVNAKATSGADCEGRTGTVLTFTVSERPQMDPDAARIHVYYREDSPSRAGAVSARSYTCTLKPAAESWIVESCS